MNTTHCNTLSCNTLQHATKHCNALQHTELQLAATYALQHILYLFWVPFPTSPSANRSDFRYLRMSSAFVFFKSVHKQIVYMRVCVCVAYLRMGECVAVCCSVLQRVAACCSASQCVA